MTLRGYSSHVPMNPKFVVTTLVIVFIISFLCVLGMLEHLPGGSGLWACIFITTIGTTFFTAGFVQVISGFKLYFSLKHRQMVTAVISGAKRERKRLSSDSKQYKTLYYPKMTYCFRGEKHTRTAFYGATHPKWSKGDEITLYIDPETGNAAEKRDALRGVGLPALAIVLGGGIAVSFWYFYSIGIFE